MALNTLRLSASMVVVRLKLYLEGINIPIMIIRAKNPAIEIKIVPTITCLTAIKVAIIYGVKKPQIEITTPYADKLGPLFV